MFKNKFSNLIIKNLTYPDKDSLYQHFNTILQHFLKDLFLLKTLNNNRIFLHFCFHLVIIIFWLINKHKVLTFFLISLLLLHIIFHQNNRSTTNNHFRLIYYTVGLDNFVSNGRSIFYPYYQGFGSFLRISSLKTSNSKEKYSLKIKTTPSYDIFFFVGLLIVYKIVFSCFHFSLF